MGSIRSLAPSPSRVNGKTWQATRRRNPPYIFRRRATRRRSFLFLLLETLFGGDPQPPSTLRASAPLLVLRDWHCLSVSPGHRASPGPGCFAGPSWPLRSASSASVARGLSDHVVGKDRLQSSTGFFGVATYSQINKYRSCHKRHLAPAAACPVGQLRGH
jgi:hypothetical protein